MKGQADTWGDLEPPWQAALSLSWEALGARTIPIGAVLAAPDGTIVGSGRNRMYDTGPFPPGELARSLLAHAEVNALIGLDPERRYEEYILYTALEPCVLCVGATVMSTVGTIRYAGADPYGGADGGLVAVNVHMRRVPVALDGPRRDVVGLFASSLVVAFYLLRNPQGRVVLAFQDERPYLVEAAEALLQNGVIEAATGGIPLEAYWHVAVTALEPIVERSVGLFRTARDLPS